MNTLSKYLVENILIEQSTNKLIVVYAGRFQPFHSGHYKAYQNLVKKFGSKSVYIATSNITDATKSPFVFKEKKQIMTKMFKIPASHIIQIKNPFAPSEILNKFPEDSTTYIAVVGNKDKDRLAKSKYFDQWSDSKKDLESYRDGGYYYVTPKETSSSVSGTLVRNTFKSNGDKETFFKKMYGKFDKKIFDLINNKLNEGIIITPELLSDFLETVNIEEILQESAGAGVGADDGPGFVYRNYNDFVTHSSQRAQEIGYTAINFILNPKDFMNTVDYPRYPDGPVGEVSFGPKGVVPPNSENERPERNIVKNQNTFTSWNNHIKKFTEKLGWEIVDYIGAKSSLLNFSDSFLDSLNADIESNFPADVNESTINEMPYSDLKDVDKFADKKLNPADIVLTGKHFFDRLNDPRNAKEITQAELIGFFKRLSKDKKKFLEFMSKYKEIVAVDNKTNINIPFMKLSNKIIAKTVMRKNDFKTSNPKYKFESLITEGGAYGHMSHPFDDMNLTFNDLKRMVELGLSGNLNVESGVSEKTDGQNITISWKTGKLIAARNKGHLKNFGENAPDAEGIKQMFAGRGDISDAFNFAIRDLSTAISKLSQKQREKIFDEGHKFMSLEVIFPATTNVIPYDSNILIFHGTREYDADANVIGQNVGDSKLLANMIKQVNQNVQKTFSIDSLPIVKLPKSKTFDKSKTKYITKLDKLKKQFKLRDSDEVSLYHQSWWESFISKNAKKYKYSIPNNVLVPLVKRWAFFDKSYSIAQMKKTIDNKKFLDWAIKFDKTNHIIQSKKNMEPFELLFLKLGAEILSNIQPIMAVNPDKSIRKMQKSLMDTIKELQSTSDVTKLNKLKKELKRLDAIGGSKAIVPMEGIVFNFKGNTYKLTGTFAPLNQILGMLKF